jgi:hypothetical protein
MQLEIKAESVDFVVSRAPQGMTFVQAAELLAAHLSKRAVPEPVSLSVTTRWGRSEVIAQLGSTTVAGAAGKLLAWAGTLTAVAVTAWRPPESDRVHLTLTSTLTSPVGSVELYVFAATKDGPAWFTDLTCGRRRSVFLAELSSWVATTPSSSALGTPGIPR